MGNSVYAEGMGFFHKGSGGQGVAPGDVCLSPPPPPTGPVPVPYVNMLSASDLTKGSKSVKIQGNPTALENASEVATSTGDEAGTQGGGVITHKTKGKGTFKLWSFVVKVEGKGVARHGDTMGQNEMSDPPNCVDAQAIVDFNKVLGDKAGVPCTVPYDQEKHRAPLNKPHYDKTMGGPCWECAKLPTNPGVWDTLISKVNGANQYSNGTLIVVDRKRGRVHQESKFAEDGSVEQEAFTPDHQPPLSVAWAMGGCHMEKSPDAFLKHMGETDRVKPHCRKHAQSQGSQADAYARSKYPGA
ncbi:DUF4150 domain-containing protein [Mesorhizobium sp. M7A.F.Ca.MR.176.00.0.0]|uniref:DUF4150 domain-containing protein n=1 Tax=Mesorhizobium sp. M7A.F.Ca.MR.176.00.0.0 TaxID=2496776 RepID=UPI000FD2C16D|nr:DUF4150 domain-containing protein [Mesorhizobium sp. M7A.F.Ca.MR.176.00.0.0]RUU93777.1 DUF4150 domain-containing protein [Mesorhizobium sp. M7A.F.Ca.MR.176.00.0.0]